MIGQTIGNAIAGGIAYAHDAGRIRDLPAFADASPELVRAGVQSMRQFNGVDGQAWERLAGSEENQQLLYDISSNRIAQSYESAATASGSGASIGEDDIVVTGHRLSAAERQDFWINQAEAAYVSIGGLDTRTAGLAFGELRSGLASARSISGDAAALGSRAVDNMAIAGGRIAVRAGEILNGNPWLRYSLEGLALVSGPIQYALGKAADALTAPAIGALGEVAAGRFGAAGYDTDAIRFGAAGVMGVGALAIGAVIGVNIARIARTIRSSLTRLDRALDSLNFRGLPAVADTGRILLSRARFGHAFERHGSGATEFLTRRAAGSGMPQGQFLDDQGAAQFILDNLGATRQGAVSLPVPQGLPVRVIMPDGSFVPASTIRLVPGGRGVSTAYPEP